MLRFIRPPLLVFEKARSQLSAPIESVREPPLPMSASLMISPIRLRGEGLTAEGDVNTFKYELEPGS